MISIKKLEILDGIELKEATFKNKNFPTHFHETYSIGVIKNGIENIQVRGHNLVATPKTVVIMNMNELHANSFYNEESWTYQTININLDVLSFIRKQTGTKANARISFKNLINDDFLYNAISNFHQTAESKSIEQVNHISKYLLQNYLTDHDIEVSTYTDWKYIIAEIQALMNEKLYEKINIENLAKRYNKTVFQLIRAFKTHTGLTPIAYLTLIRLNKAKQLLIQGDTLVDTALSCGFFDQSHFANSFKKYFGVSPKQYCNSYTVLKTL